MGQIIGKLLARYLAAVAGSVIGFFMLLSVYITAEALEIDIVYATCKDAILVPLLFGVPTGNILAIVVVDWFVHKVRPLCYPAIAVGAIGTLPGIPAGILLMDYSGSQAIFSIPFLSAAISAPAYHIMCRYFHPARCRASKAD